MSRVSSIVTAYDREAITRATIARLLACEPPPEEIIVHFDNGAEFSLPDGVKILRSTKNLGPGGARNLLVQAAMNEWVASFDDDSFPESIDFFAQVKEQIGKHAKAGVLACSIRHRDPIHDSPGPSEDAEVAAFVGCGCIYRKSAFLATRGYVSLPVAYGMEEVDLALQLHQLDIPIIHCPKLVVVHDTELSHHESARITAGAIQNQALLAWLRYPIESFPYGFMQWLNKIRDSLLRRRFAGAVRGIVSTPGHVWRYRSLRKPVSASALAGWRNLRIHPRPCCGEALSPD